MESYYHLDLSYFASVNPENNKELVLIQPVRGRNYYVTHRPYKKIRWRLKGTVMQIEKALINDRLRVSQVS